MCTLTWIRRSEGYELVSNRDERSTRRPATPPVVDEQGGVRYLAPGDGDAGGTWIAVNELGVALVLLNAEGSGGGGHPFTSRGLLVRELADAGSLAEVAERLATRDLGWYRGFRLAVFEPGRDVAVSHWDGRRLGREAGASMPLVSSPLDPVGARAARRSAFRRRAESARIDPALLLDFHASHEPRPGPWSVCMHGRDAGTVSASHVTVGRERIAFRHAPGPPCRTPWGAPVGLARRVPTP